MRIEIAPGVRLFVDIEGFGLVPDGPTLREKPTLLLLHGGPGFDHSGFKPAFSPLADIAQIVTYDHRGHGRSDERPVDEWSLDNWADDVVRLCDALGIVKPIVLGQSFGGFVAQRYIARHPGHPAKVILSSTSPAFNLERKLPVFERLGGRAARELAETFWRDPTEENTEAYLRDVHPLYNTRRPTNDDGQRRARLRLEILRHFIVHEMHGMNLLPGLAQARCPVLVMAGAQDPVCPPADSEDIAAALPAHLAELQIYANSGHGAWRDEPEAAFAALRRFIERMTDGVKRIAIVGAGTAGQAVAIALGRAHADAEIMLFEQSPNPGPVGAGFLLQPTGQAVLARWGLLAEAQSLGANVQALRGRNASGRLVMDMHYGDATPERQGLGMQRGALYELLQRNQPTNVWLRPGRTVTRLEPEIGLLHTDDGRRNVEWGPFDLIVVADGSRSRLRDAWFGKSCARPYPWGVWWCLVPAEGWAGHHALNQRYRLARQMAGVLPVGRRAPGLPPMLCLYWSVPAQRTPARGMGSHELADALAPLWPDAAAHLRGHSSAPLAHATYRAVNLPRWHRHGVVWIGDAAHGMSPQLGQGVNMALLDAMALADVLGPELAVDRLPQFEAQRRRHVRWYRWASHALTPLFQSDWDNVARLRDLVFAPAGRVPGVRGLSRRLAEGSLGLPSDTFPAK